jgi:dTDP-4-amino-4,6-dideoxygalactose transaminase
VFFDCFLKNGLKSGQENDGLNIMEMKAEPAGFLAIDGGSPVRENPFPAWPVFSREDIDAVEAVLLSGKVNYWTGQESRNFEVEFAHFCRAKHAVALANGTVALELALKSLGVGPGDEVVVTSRSFFASASAIVLQGAKAVFVDVDPDTQNITAETIAPALSSRTKAIIAVHLAGMPCDMDPIMDLAKAHELFVVEDCAQAHGALYKGRPVGGLGHAAAFSFCQDKILTTGGEGGMLVTNDPGVWKRVWSKKDHGKSYDEVYGRDHAPGFRWLHSGFGTNGRMTEMQAAIGRQQLPRLSEWNQKRRANADLLDEGFGRIPALRILETPQNCVPARYKYYAFIRPEMLEPGWDQGTIRNAINAEGVPCFGGSCSEIYREKAFQGTDMEPVERLSVARQLGETSLMFLVHPTLGEPEMQDTIDAVAKVFQVASRVKPQG